MPTNEPIDPIYCYVCGVQMERKIHRILGPGWRCPDCGRFIADSELVAGETDQLEWHKAG